MSCRMLFLLVALPGSGICLAQEGRGVIHFIDHTSGTPVRNIIIIDNQGTTVARGDSSGFAILQLSVFEQGKYLLAISPGYKPDTLYKLQSTIYMQPLTVSLEEATVSSSHVYELLKKPAEYVIDYTISGNNILAATYSSHKNAKLFLMSDGGTIIANYKLPAEPTALYKSCVNNVYCVFNDVFYPVSVAGNEISLRQPYNINMLPGLTQCELSIDGNLYYKITNKLNFCTEYGMIKKGDTAFKQIMKFEEQKIAQASFEELMEILALLDANQFSEAKRRQLLRSKWDRGALANINLPVCSRNDTLVIFDYSRKKLYLYNLMGDAICSVPVHFDWHSSQQFRILKDDPTNKIYIHRYDKQGTQTIEELDIASGSTFNKTTIIKPFAEQVNVHNGNIYFLWQDKYAGTTRQLYIQRTN